MYVCMYVCVGVHVGVTSGLSPVLLPRPRVGRARSLTISLFGAGTRLDGFPIKSTRSFALPPGESVDGVEPTSETQPSDWDVTISHATAVQEAPC